MGIKIFGTDIHGNIILIKDGQTYDIKTQKNGEMEENEQETAPKEADQQQQVSDQSCIDINSASKEI
jgi:competence protein ComEC